MDTGGLNKIKTALDDLRKSHAEVEAAFKIFDEQELSQENVRLRETVERLNAQLQEIKDETAALRQQHEELIHNFKHELSSKRIVLLGLSKRQHQAYLKAGLEREQMRVDALYAAMQKTMADMSVQLSTLDADEREPLLAELTVLRHRVNESAKQAQARKDAAWRDAANRQADALSELESSPVGDAALGAVRQFFAWEAFLGLKIISAVGALLLLLGVFTFGRYLYIKIGPMLQCASIFVFGLLLMGIGEAFYRKKWQGGFTLALTAGGSGILFLGAALGYITLGVLPMWAALGLCAGVSLLTFAASLRYNAQLIAVFALIGGYLPIIALKGSVVLFGAIYFSVLSLLALLIATRKNWRVARFIGLGAGLIAQLLLLINSFSIERSANTTLAVIGAFIAISFVAYLIIPVLSAWFTKTNIQTADIVLLSCNVFFSFLIGLWWGSIYAYTALESEWHYYTGIISALIAAFFAVCCIVMAFATERQRHSGVPASETGSLRALFFITSITFFALIVPFALESVWFSLGWLIQAAGLALYGIFKNRRRFNIAALVIGVCCLWTFVVFNVPNSDNPLFVWQYLSITLAAAGVSCAALKRKPEEHSTSVLLDVFRFAAVVNLWGYLVYALYHPLWPTLRQWLGGSGNAYSQWLDDNANSFAALLSITFGFALAFLLPRIKRVYNYGFQIAAIALGAINTWWLLSFNAGAGGLAGDHIAIGAAVFAL